MVEDSTAARRPGLGTRGRASGANPRVNPSNPTRPVREADGSNPTRPDPAGRRRKAGGPACTDVVKRRPRARGARPCAAPRPRHASPPPPPPI